jgi:hypothetical protein
MRKGFVATCVLLLFVCGLSVSADASTFDKRTYFTFSQPITLPGVTLPAGTYMFRLADPTTGRKVVQVMSQNGMQSYAMVLSIPAQRRDLPDEPEISFMETPAGMPAAVQTWWHQGERTGHELVYSRQQKARLAAGISSQPPADITSVERSEAAAPIVDTESAAGKDTSYSEERAGAVVLKERDETFGVAPGAAQSETAAPVAAPAEPQTTPAPSDERIQQGRETATPSEVRDELPATASVIPLMSILGLGLAFGGFWLTRKH